MVGTWTLNRLLHEIASWALMVASVFGIFAFNVDCGAVLMSGHSLRVALASGLTGAAFAAWVGLIVAPIITLLAAASSFVEVRAPRLWAVPIALASLGATLWLFASGPSALMDGTGTFASRATQVGFVVVLVLTVAAARSPRPAVRLTVGRVVLLLGYIELFVSIHKPLRDLRDLIVVLALVGGVAIVSPIRRRIVCLPSQRLALWVALCAITPFGILLGVDRAAPGWRAVSWQYAIHEPRLARFARAVVDADFDGYSPIAWGTDCDDFDGARRPSAHEARPGVDMNCNGATLPEHPTDSDRGLAPPLGNPDAELVAGNAPLVLLVTIDCWRADAFRPDVMPNLTAYAARGVVLRRMYSGGTRTVPSMRLIERGFDQATPVGVQLGGVGIASTAVFPFGKEFVNAIQFAGFTTRLHGTGRWNAAETTDVALGDLRANAVTHAAHLLWVHYIDAHTPYTLAPSAFPYAPDLDRTFATYLAELAFVDRELARLLDTISSEKTRPVTVILTGDHGEGFGRHNIRDHGISGYEELIHVPAIVVAPGLGPGGYDEVVSHRDIHATILGAFGRVAVSPDAERFGRSWLRLRASLSTPLHRFVVSRSARGVRGALDLTPMAALVERDLTLIETFEDGLLELYAPREDPTESNDLAFARAADAARLHHELALFQDIEFAPR